MELAALERLKNRCHHVISVDIDPIVFKLAGNKDMHNIMNEFEFRPDRTTDYGVSCPWASKKYPYRPYNGENGVSTFSLLFLIGSFWYFHVTRTSIKAWMSLNFLKWDLTLAHWTQVSDRCPLGYLLAHLSHWLIGEFTGRPPSSSSTLFKHLGNHLANHSQISHGASLWWGNGSLLKMILVTWPRWLPCPYMVKTFKILWHRSANINETWYTALGTRVLSSLLKWWP